MAATAEWQGAFERPRWLAAVVFGAIVLMSACGPLAQAPVSSTAVAPGPSPTVGQQGFLEGQAQIGPLEPVQRVGVPPPSPAPGACTSRGLVIYAADSGAEMQRVSFADDCSYQVALAPGQYRVELQPHGIDRTTDLPKVVQIRAGETTRLDISIDTGIR